ncbi:diaminopimelate epimerase [Arenimonas caeni]|jgi:diaminopimelate epimerase|uniref:diaminopimelate epimerase n=1 Tax=Arenimonas caeni TaxID=2058085 RepID=UPI002A36FFE8|nr:diaminopimelate epimerase [Arenimonas caeni]MDY0021850.1 diaminopimelate epimerase [Arenimonas caeni]
MSAGRALRFSKMHGAGNDFVVLDLRGGRDAPGPALARRLADRHAGVGCDQLLTIEDSAFPDCLARYRIWNADGTPASQCGNGARCVAAWLRREGVATSPRFRLDSPAGPVQAEALGAGRYAIDMGRPRLAPAAIPFRADAEAVEYRLPLDGGEVAFGAVSMGNPHAVIEVADVAAAPVARLGPALQARPEFPEGVNVGFAQVLAPDRIRLRVFERGAGETLACGSGACAAVVALVRRGRLARHAFVELPGGTLEITWPADDASVVMAGPTAFVFEGELLLEQPE